MAGLGWQELVILAAIIGIVLVPAGTLIYLYVDGVHATSCVLPPPGLEVSGASTGCPIRQRPIWLVVVLTVLTFSWYLLVWFGVSWAELKRIVRNERMSPVAHALSLIVPALGLFRVHAHFRLINKLCSARGVSAGITPVAAVMAMTAVTILLIVRVGVGAAGMLGWIAIAITAAVIAMGQRGLNRLWSQQFGTAARPEVTTGEWVVLGAWAFLWLVGLGLVRFGRAMS